MFVFQFMLTITVFNYWLIIQKSIGTAAAFMEMSMPSSKSYLQKNVVRKNFLSLVTVY